MADTIQVTPQMLRSTANDIQANMEQAMGIAKGYLANQENVMNPATWSGTGVVASHMTATEITNELNKVLTGGTRLAEGLVQAAALMEGHEAPLRCGWHGYDPRTSDRSPAGICSRAVRECPSIRWLRSAKPTPTMRTMN